MALKIRRAVHLWFSQERKRTTISQKLRWMVHGKATTISSNLWWAFSFCRTIQSAFAYLNTPSVENIKNFDDLKTSEGERELGLSFLSLAKLRNQNFDIKVCKF